MITMCTIYHFYVLIYLVLKKYQEAKSFFWWFKYFNVMRLRNTSTVYH